MTLEKAPATPAATLPPSPDKARFDLAERGAAARRESQRKMSPRERTVQMGGARLKLAVRGTIDGYKMYWENDDNGAIEALLYDGFDFVSPAEAEMESALVQDADLGDRVSRYVGKKADGSPLRAYLLKCPQDVWDERENARYAQADEWDSAIKAGKIQHGDGRYTPKGANISLDTQYKK
jgi:hypothetical protein